MISPDLTRELGLTAADLGLLTSTYFFAFGLAQIPVGAPVYFTLVSVAEAQVLARAQHALITGLPDAVREVGGGALSSEFLLAANLAGAATAGED